MNPISIFSPLVEEDEGEADPMVYCLEQLPENYFSFQFSIMPGIFCQVFLRTVQSAQLNGF